MEEIEEKQFLNLTHNEVIEVLSRHMQNDEMIREIAASIFNIIASFNNSIYQV